MKKDIKVLFSAIRKHENTTVRALLADNPNLVNACASAPPKKDDGQSPLQVAFKTSNFEIASHLIDLGANINFMEESIINEWVAPVLHDALRATIFNARDGIIVDRGYFATAFSLVQRMLELGADPNAFDSYGNNSLLRALLDSRQRLSIFPGFPEHVENEKLKHDLRDVFTALIEAGADIHASKPQSESAVEFAHEHVLAELLQRRQ